MRIFLKSALLISGVVFFAFTTRDTDNGYKVPHPAYSVFSSDIDLDGHNDLIVGNAGGCYDSNATISLLKNNGYGIFLAPDTSLSFCGEEEEIIAARINADFLPDIIGIHFLYPGGPMLIRILFNDGTGLFPTYNDYPLNSYENYSNIGTGDFNGDGHLDVAYTQNVPQKWAVMYNDGQGNLSAPVYSDLSFPPQDISTGDLNGDSIDDIVISGHTIIFYSITTGFQAQYLNWHNSDISVKDMNKDWVNDIVAIDNGFWLAPVYIYENIGNKNYINHPLDTIWDGCEQLVVSDLNNDSLPDLLLMPYSMDGIYIMYNMGNFNFGSQVFLSVPNDIEQGRYLFSADFDGNVYNDIAIVRWGGPNGETFNNLIILYNDGNGNFNPYPVGYGKTLIDQRYELLTIYPNPFFNELTVSIRLSRTEKADVRIYNFQGLFINCLCNEIQNKGNLTLIWNGDNRNGTRCPSGIYFIVLKINGNVISTKKVILI